MPITTSPSIVLGTYDVDAIAVSSSQANTISLSASYVENSPAQGILFVLILANGVGDIESNQPIYLVLDREESQQVNVTRGSYTVLGFDVEGDGALALGSSSPAAVGIIMVHGEGECVCLIIIIICDILLLTVVFLRSPSTIPLPSCSWSAGLHSPSTGE